MGIKFYVHVCIICHRVYLQPLNIGLKTKKQTNNGKIYKIYYWNNYYNQIMRNCIPNVNFGNTITKYDTVWPIIHKYSWNLIMYSSFYKQNLFLIISGFKFTNWPYVIF